MSPNPQQLLTDLYLLLQRIYPTKKAISEEMARYLKKDPGRFYGLFIRCTGSAEAMTKQFMYSFYKVFQADLDTIKREEDARDMNKESLKMENAVLHNDLCRAIENNTVLVLTNQKLVEAQLELLARLKI